LPCLRCRPGLFERLAENYTHLSLGWIIGGTSGTALIAGLCYGLGGCFLVHLLTRAYWVGLIGLRTVFPSGINWDRTPRRRADHPGTLSSHPA
jgi:hypothetical protein